MSDNIRAEILKSIRKSATNNIVITHGTYTMPDTARYLSEHDIGEERVVVLTGSMYPLQGFAPSDAPFNLGFAIAAAFTSEPGVYLAMNGRRFAAHEVEKNIDAGRFIPTPG